MSVARDGNADDNREMNQSETIFVRRSSSGRDAPYFIRSFTPYKEEPFCGHGLMAAAIILSPYHAQGEMSFRTVDGIMVKACGSPSEISRSSNEECGAVCAMKLQMPSVPINEWFHRDSSLRDRIAKCLGIKTSQVVALGRNALMDLVIELDSEVDFSAANMPIDAVELMKLSPSGTRSQIITSRGDRYGVDFVKRVFAYGSEGKSDFCFTEMVLQLTFQPFPSDQATGSTYCVLIPYWSSNLKKPSMKVKQVSERTGDAQTESVTSNQGYVAVSGSGVKVMEGRIMVPGTRGSSRLAKL